MFFTKYSPAPSLFQDTEGASLTQQQFKDDADINVIIKRYQEVPQTSLTSVSGPRVPLWGDFSGLPDVREAHYFFEQAAASFKSLPAEVRDRFHNNPLELLSFVENASAEEQRAVLGDRAPASPKVVQPVTPTSEVNAETLKNS